MAARSKPEGQGSSASEIRDLKRQLEDLAEDVLEGRLDRGKAAVVNQIHNTRARLIEIERRVREQDELLERIGALEQAAQTLERRAPGGYARAASWRPPWG